MRKDIVSLKAFRLVNKEYEESIAVLEVTEELDMRFNKFTLEELNYLRNQVTLGFDGKRDLVNKTLSEEDYRNLNIITIVIDREIVNLGGEV